MTVKEIPVNIRCLEYRQDREDVDYGSCLYARFYFNLDKYELNIISDCGNYAYQCIGREKEIGNDKRRIKKALLKTN